MNRSVEMEESPIEPQSREDIIRVISENEDYRGTRKAGKKKIYVKKMFHCSKNKP